jgi:hypothetical protein
VVCRNFSFRHFRGNARCPGEGYAGSRPGSLLGPYPSALKMDDTASSNVFVVGLPGAAGERSRASLATTNPCRAFGPRSGNVNQMLASTSNAETARTVTGQYPASWGGEKGTPFEEQRCGKVLGLEAPCHSHENGICPRPDCQRPSSAARTLVVSEARGVTICGRTGVRLPHQEPFPGNGARPLTPCLPPLRVLHPALTDEAKSVLSSSVPGPLAARSKRERPDNRASHAAPQRGACVPVA